MNKLFPQPEVLLTTSNKSDGNMSFTWASDPSTAVENRQRFLKSHGLQLENCVTSELEHEEKILTVNNDDEGRGMADPDSCPKTEALIANTPGLGLFMLTADCFPVAYYDPVKKIIALAHLGWKPAGKKLAAKVVKQMQNEFDCKPSDLRVNIGPGIHPESYRYDNPQQKALSEWQPYLKQVPDSDEVSIDLLGFVKDQLKEAGIRDENLSVSNVDTAIDTNYYSHYRAKQTGEAEGRFATVICLR